MPRRSRVLLLVAAAAVVVAAAAGGYFFFGGDEPPPAELSSAGGDAGGGDSPEAIEGTWQVVSGTDDDPTFAGYRVTETALGIGRPTEAVGRTRDVEGTITIEGTTITAAEFTVDVSTLQSDESRRDGVLRSRGLELDEFPTAAFALTEPIDLGELPAPGEPVSVTAVGDLTLHGQTQRVSVPLDTVLAVESDPRIEVAGGGEIALADFGIEPPSVSGVVTVEDRGTFEVHLFLERQAETDTPTPGY
jgi:polyisoprenoid-binding protein YceI